MRDIRTMTVGAMALVLAACGNDGDGASDTIISDDAGRAIENVAKADVSGGMGSGALQSDLPDHVPAYPGARVEGDMTISSGDKGARNVQMLSDDSIDDILDFYEERAKAAGYEVERTRLTGDVGMGSLSVKTGEGSLDGYAVQVFANDDGKSGITLMLGQGR
ncbi:hypothetical protein [Sphingomicrobium arenosum]|uniref:hypothetical protein n=1 Tax=Sphingomicrobium arenosum TaxID=2233861 RepID=UPI00223EC6EA|nr:hypothetical protein [Sphingomicrobium arenosum]